MAKENLIERLRTQIRRDVDVGVMHGLMAEAASEIEFLTGVADAKVGRWHREMRNRMSLREQIRTLEQELADCRGDQHACKYLAELTVCLESARSQDQHSGGQK